MQKVFWGPKGRFWVGRDLYETEQVKTPFTRAIKACKRLIQKRAKHHIWEFSKGSRSPVLAPSVQHATAAFSNISAFMESGRTRSSLHEPVWMLSYAKSIPYLMESLGLFPILVSEGGWNPGFQMELTLGISQACSAFDCSSPKGGEAQTGGMTASQPVDLCQGNIRVSSFHAFPYH